MSLRHDRDDCLDGSSRRPAAADGSADAPAFVRFRKFAHPPKPTGYTLAESLIFVGLLAVLAALLLPVISRARQASRAVACLSNLRNLTGAFRSYAQDNAGRLPYPAVTGIPWERSLLKYAPPPLFICPADQELAPATNSSYDWRDTGVPNTTLAGLGLDNAGRADAVLVFDALPSWHQQSRMNVGLIDGSARSMDQDQCISDLSRAIRP